MAQQTINTPRDTTLQSTNVILGQIRDAIGAQSLIGDTDISQIADGTVTGAIAELDNGKLDANLKGSANGVAELDSNGFVPASQLPSFVDDVLEYANLASFPTTGESGKIYVALDTNKTYRWGGTDYVVISDTIALGETSTTAYRGDRGKTAYDHATETKIGQMASGLYKVASTAEGHIASLAPVQKPDITGLGIPAQDTTYDDATTSTSGLMSATDKTKLNEIADGATNVEPSATNGNVKINGKEAKVYDESSLPFTVKNGMLCWVSNR